MRKKKQKAFTVAVGSQHSACFRVYAVRASDASGALDAARAAIGADEDLELCGHLSDKLAVRLRIKPGKAVPI